MSIIKFGKYSAFLFKYWLFLTSLPYNSAYIFCLPLMSLYPISVLSVKSAVLHSWWLVIPVNIPWGQEFSGGPVFRT